MSVKAEDTLFSELKRIYIPTITANTAGFDDSWNLNWRNNLATQMVYWMVSRYAVIKPKTPLSGDKDTKIPTLGGPVVEKPIVVADPGGSVTWRDFKTNHCTYSEIAISDLAELCFDSILRACFFRLSIRTSIGVDNIPKLSEISNSIRYDQTARTLTAGCDTFSSGVVGLAVALLFNSGTLSLGDAKKRYEVLIKRCTMEGGDKYDKSGKVEKSETCDALEKYINAIIST